MFKSLRSNKKMSAAAILIVAFILTITLGTIAYAMSGSTVGPCTVNNKESVSTKDGHQYRVYTDECGVFVVTDSFVALKFDAANRFNDIKVGNRYEFETQGFRLSFVSSFPNIISIAPA